MLFNIQRWSLHDGAGIRTTVFFKGCPMRCRWCSNPESWTFASELMFNQDVCVACGACIDCCPAGANSLSGSMLLYDRRRCQSCGICVEHCGSASREVIGLSLSVEEVLARLRRDSVFYRQSGGGVTFSGGEPFAQPQLLKALATGCVDLGISLAVETCGYVDFTDADEEFSWFEEIYIDLKHTDNEHHKLLTGVSNHKVLHTITELDRSNRRFTIRVPMIAGLTDTEQNVQGLIDFSRRLDNPVRLELLPYHQLGYRKYAELGLSYDTTMAAPAIERLENILQQLRFTGIEAACPALSG